MYCRDLGFEGKDCIAIQSLCPRYSKGMGAGQALGVQVGAGRACVLGVQGTRAAGRAGRWGGRRWGARQGERACGRASGRAAGRAAGLGARARGAGGSGRSAGRTGARRWADWAMGEQARGACAAGAGSVRGIGRQGARLVCWLGQLGARALDLIFKPVFGLGIFPESPNEHYSL